MTRKAYLRCGADRPLAGSGGRNGVVCEVVRSQQKLKKIVVLRGCKLRASQAFKVPGSSDSSSTGVGAGDNDRGLDSTAEVTPSGATPFGSSLALPGGAEYPREPSRSASRSSARPSRWEGNLVLVPGLASKAPLGEGSVLVTATPDPSYIGRRVDEVPDSLAQTKIKNKSAKYGILLSNQDARNFLDFASL